MKTAATVMPKMQLYPIQLKENIMQTIDKTEIVPEPTVMDRELPKIIDQVQNFINQTESTGDQAVLIVLRVLGSQTTPDEAYEDAKTHDGDIYKLNYLLDILEQKLNRITNATNRLDTL